MNYKNFSFIISTDSTADLPDEFVGEESLAVLSVKYSIGGTTYGGKDGELMPSKFYGRMRDGEPASTFACRPEEISETFEELVKEELPILHFSFSSALSSCNNNASFVARDICEENKDAHIIVIDSRSASLGQGLLVWYACKLRREGKNIDEVAAWINENIQHFCHQFTVDSLSYLHRGGRVSKAAMIIGTLVNVKPLLHVDDEGRLVPVCNVRGRKKALITLVDNMEKNLGSYRDKNEIIMIGHADCLADAQFVGDLIKERFGYTNIIYNYISPTIGAHAGPGTVALFHLGDTRKL